MKSWIGVLVFGVGLSLFHPAATRGEATVPTLEQRVAGLEAYLINTDPAAAPKESLGGPITKPVSVGVPGPGHNAWMMISAALVLFMTLPGLALFMEVWFVQKMCFRSWRNVWVSQVW